MNKIIETINSRRSVRSFSDKQIPENILQEIVNAGNMAPTGSNVQPWRFVVVQDAAFKKKLLDVAMPRYNKFLENAPEAFKERRKKVDTLTNDPIYYSAPTIVFVISTKGLSADFDCPMVCENMMLAARSFDIGSCWVMFGSFPIEKEEIKLSLDLKEGEKVFGPILLGYPQNGFPSTPEKKSPVIKRI